MINVGTLSSVCNGLYSSPILFVHYSNFDVPKCLPSFKVKWPLFYWLHVKSLPFILFRFKFSSVYEGNIENGMEGVVFIKFWTYYWVVSNTVQCVFMIYVTVKPCHLSCYCNRTTSSCSKSDTDESVPPSKYIVVCTLSSQPANNIKHVH